MTGATLARSGKTVLVLEGHQIPGGYATSFRRRAVEFDVSLHLIGDLATGGELRKNLDEIGLFPRLRFHEAETLFKAVFPDRDIVAPRVVAEYCETLERLFPSDKDGMKKLFRLFSTIREEVVTVTRLVNNGQAVNVFSQAPHFLKCQGITLQVLLDTYLSSAHLKSIIAQQWMYYGLPPSYLSAAYFAYAWTEYHLYGGHYPIGRSQTISNELTAIIRESNGQVLLREPVKEIVVRENNAVGVVTVTGKAISGAHIISNADPLQTFTKLVSADVVPDRYLKRITKSKVGPSNIQAYILLDIDMRLQYGETHHEIFVNDHYDLEESYDAAMAGQYESAPLYITIYDNIHPMYQAGNNTTISLFQLSSFDAWANLDKSQYIQAKKVVMDQMLNRLERLYPGIRRSILHAELATPVTNKRYTKNWAGAIYGAAQTPDQSGTRRLPHTTPVKHLYLVGAWSQPGGGYSGVLWSGYNLAKRLLSSTARTTS